MNRPPLEVADLVRAAGRAFLERSRKWITWQHLKVLRAIARCRTAALGGHLDECTDCGVVSSLLCKRPSFVFGVAVVFGDGLQGKGVFPLPLLLRVEKS